MRNKGFTLIELLAVIIILSIVSLITVPIIMGIVNDAKKEAFGNSVYGLVSAGTMYYVDSLLYNGEMLSNVEFRIVDGNWSSSEVLEVTGVLPMSGTVIVSKSGDVSVAISNGKWCATKGFTDTLVTVIEMSLGCELPEDDTKYKDAVLKGADPELGQGMIPIVIANDGTVTVADIYDTEDPWYDYSNKLWANVVLVDETIRSSLVNNGEFKAGLVIPEVNILAYLVWIPRYRYQIWNADGNTPSGGLTPVKQNIISIVFENKTTISSNNIEQNQWLTHPAFTINGVALNGFWMGKFETGYRQDDSFPEEGETWLASNSQKNETLPQKILIKPNIPSWRNIFSGTIFNVVYNMRNTGNLFGLSTVSETHLMKNMEWGAAAYLSHSVYGVNDEIWINNCYSSSVSGPRYITGIAGNSVSESNSVGPCNNISTSTLPDIKYQWFGENGVNGSTTGNVTGVYDMSGGAWEYVAGILRFYDDETKMYVSNGMVLPTGIYTDKFNSFKNNNVDTDVEIKKYFDIYKYNDNYYGERVSRGKLGDATFELGPFRNSSDVIDPLSSTIGTNGYDRSAWYMDYAHFANSSNSWFGRGGSYGANTGSGVFAFGRFHGGYDVNYSFRIVIWP